MGGKAKDAYLGELAHKAVLAEEARGVVEAVRFLLEHAPYYLIPDIERIEKTIKGFEALARGEDLPGVWDRALSTISAAKVEALAKRGHAKCHGRGVLGFRPGTHGVRPGTHAAVLCSCVFRILRRQGVNINDQAAVFKALAPDPPAGEEA